MNLPEELVSHARNNTTFYPLIFREKKSWKEQTASTGRALIGILMERGDCNNCIKSNNCIQNKLEASTGFYKWKQYHFWWDYYASVGKTKKNIEHILYDLHRDF